MRIVNGSKEVILRQLKASDRPLPIGHEGLRVGRLISTVLSNVLHQADDLPWARTSAIDHPADRVLVAKTQSCQFTIDDQHWCRALVVRLAKIAASNKRNAERCEITAADDTHVGKVRGRGTRARIPLRKRLVGAQLK